MITGFNTDIDSDGQVYHVQTEDKGLANPTIETLVYTGGQIVCSRKSSYAELVVSGQSGEDVILQRMETQHRTVIREIRDGTLSKEDLEPFGWKIVSNKSFDEVVQTFLEEHLPLEKIRVALIDPRDVRAGERQNLTLEVTEDTSERPIRGARVVVKLVDRADGETELLSAQTDDWGRVDAPCEIPPKPGAGAALLCEAEAAGKTAEVRCRVKRAARASAREA
jgi:hypothetical protein